ncbi:hypothetical protein SAMN05192574_102600 [Mucilaginibacter gossypiicola]|uniref:CarboxypepD_reg-like domain-containing protein n=1 Tax=Mucilaginibacter gossypiicola TaxID=551995 RepID=A0A1H8E6C0_9SPHI|nr:hypothetical protein [Mucilaginibacter gossypiicola]SEN15119.1 hypothetical protein SAMN05192574_102600 [Mucilaginibacter gossypiicola]
MKKPIVTILAVIASVNLFAQSQNIRGIVSDQQGEHVPFAFLVDVDHKVATYSDSTGVFNLEVQPSSKILVLAGGHKEYTFTTDQQKSYNIVLQGKNEAIAGGKLNTKVTNNFDTFSTHAGALNTQAGNISVTNHQDATQGSRYLYDSWVHGYVISAADSIVQNTHYLFNYDKISGNLMVNKDNNTVLQIDGNSFKSFVLFDKQVNNHAFVKVPAITPQRYVEVIVDGPKYKIYKDVATKFHKADFSTNGIASTGNNYDEYIDQNFYYVVKDGGQPVKLQLKKKSLKEAFAADSDKLNKFMAAAGSDDIDENYLKQLGDNLNK